MSRSLIKIGPFAGGLVSAFGGDAPGGSAQDALNARTTRRDLRFRRGFERLSPRVQGKTSVYGVARLRGYGDDYGALDEVLMVRKEGGRVRPVSFMAPSYSVPVEIKSGTENVTLEERRISAFTFRGKAYVIQPGAAKSVFEHAIGDPTSWITIQDSKYTPPDANPAFSAELVQGEEVPWTAADITNTPVTQVGSGTVGSPTYSIGTNGQIVVTGTGGRNGGNDSDVLVTVTFASPKDLSRGIVSGGYVALRVETGSVWTKFRGSGMTLELYTSNTWFTVATSGGADSTITGVNSDTGITFIFKTGINLSAVEKMRMRLKSYVADPSGPSVAYTIRPFFLGGFDLLATNAAFRPWAGAQPTDRAITYGARCRRISTNRYSEIVPLAVKGALGPFAPGPDPVRMGAYGNLFFDGLDTTEFPRDANPISGSNDTRIQFLRQDAGGTWRVLQEVPNQPSQRIYDARREDIVAGLPESPPGSYVAPPPSPPFTSQGLKGGVAYRDWVVWLFQGGKSNIRHSRVGNAREIRSESATYDPQDTTRPGTYTMADGFADEPVGAVQAGQLLVILGSQGVYAQYGEAPSAMTPSRRIPEVAGVAGLDAYCRWKAEAGGYGVAWLDPHGNIWGLRASPRFEGDVSVRPEELSLPIRGDVRRLLGLSPGESLAGAMLGYDEAEDALFIVLGRRGVIVRPRDGVDGPRRVEVSLWNVVEDEYETSVWSPWSSVSTANQTGDGASFTTTIPDTVSLSAGQTSKLLTRSSFLAGMIPSGNNVMEMQARITDTGDAILQRTVSVGGPTDGPALVGSPGVSALTFPANTLLTRAQIEAGGAYSKLSVTRLDNPAWYVGSNWTVSALPSGQAGGIPGTALSVALTVTATYIGPSPAPGPINWNVTGRANCALCPPPTPPVEPVNYVGSASVANGLGQTDSGPIASYTQHDGDPPSREAKGTGVVTFSPQGGNVYSGIVVTTGTATRISGNNYSKLISEITAASVAPDVPRTYSGTVEMRVRYGAGNPESPGTFAAIAFDGGKLLAARSDGALVILERNLAGVDITYPTNGGTGIDASRPAPGGFWTTPSPDGPRIRVSDVLLSAVPPLPTAIKFISEEGSWTIPAKVPSCRFPVQASGRRGAVRIEFNESLGSIDRLAIEATRLSEKRTT